MSSLERSWGAFSPQRAREYLTTYGHPSVESREIVGSILAGLARRQAITLLDLGCGNGGMAAFLREKNVNVAYTGVDFSEPLLAAARAEHPDAVFIKDDVQTLSKVDGRFDVLLYSHVLEMLGSPQASLLRAAEIAPVVIVRFFEPPDGDVDLVELLEMDVGETTVPYLRRTMSNDYYRLILHAAGVHSVEVYRAESARDQVHVLRFS